MPSVDEFVDLDNFLDSYLTQLHSDTQAGRVPSGNVLGAQNMQGIANQMMGNQGMTGLTGLLHPQGPNSAMSFDGPNQAPQQQPGGGLNILNQLGGMSGLAAMQGMNPLSGGLGSMQSGLLGMQGGFGQPAPNNLSAGFPGASGLGQPPNIPSNAFAGVSGLAGLMAQQQQLMQQQQPGLSMGMSLGQQQPMQMQQRHAPAVQNTGGAKGGAGPKSGRGGRGRGAGGPKNARGKSEAEPSSSEHLEDTSDTGSSDGGGEHKARKKQMTTDEAERRHQALQEKNRRAQRRFRERQKTKLQDLHKQIEELTTRVSSLQNENAALHSRTSILEKVLDMRNEQIQVMQETKESNQYPGGEEELLQLQDMGGQLVQLTPEMIKDLSSDQIYKIYQMYVKELSNQLTDAPALTANTDGSVGPPTAGSPSTAPSPGALDIQVTSPELEKLVKDLSMMIMRLGVIKPLETRKFIVVSRQYLGSSEAEVIELWKNVMKSIDLTEQQKREIVELKRMFLQKIEPIMEERKHLNVQIQANLPHDTFHTKNALTYIKAHEAVIKLRDNLRAEQHVVLEFAIAVFRGVFRPRQMATLLVKCYPAVPDALGIASALASELGEPDTPAARQLALQLGGYLENSGAHNYGTTMMTLQPSNVPGAAGASGAALVPGVGGAAAPPGTTASTSSGTRPHVAGGPGADAGQWAQRSSATQVPNALDIMNIAAVGSASAALPLAKGVMMQAPPR